MDGSVRCVWSTQIVAILLICILICKLNHVCLVTGVCENNINTQSEINDDNKIIDIC